MANLLKETHELLLQEQKRVQKLADEFVQEVTNKYNSYLQIKHLRVNAHKEYLEIKTVFDDAIKKLCKICDFLIGPDTGYLIDKVITTSVSLSSADSDRIQGLLKRFEVMEKAMTGYSTDNDNIRKAHDHMDTKLKNMADLMKANLDKTEAKQGSLERRLTEITVKLDKEKEALVKSLGTLEKETKATMNKEKEENAKRDKKHAELRQQLTDLSTSWLETYNGVEMCISEINIHIDTAFKTLEGNKASLMELADRCQYSEQLHQASSKHIRDLGTTLQGTQRALVVAVEDLKEQTRRVDVNTSDAQAFKCRQDNTSRDVGKIKNSIRMLEEKTDFDKGEFLKVKDEYENLKREVTLLTGQVRESLDRTSTVGFTAKPLDSTTVQVNPNSAINKFTAVTHNPGDYYDDKTGCFTAPVNGLYVCGVTICTLNQGRINVAVRHRPGNAARNDRNVKPVCRVSATAQDNSCSGFGVVRMEAGDTLYMVPTTVSEDAVLSSYSSFSCFLVA